MNRSPSPDAASPDSCRRVAFPPERRLVLDTLRLGHRKPMMIGLLELDVTRAREILREHRKRTGEALSFTAFVLTCLGKAVAAHPEVHALRDWRRGVVLFDDVDATTIIEVETEGRPFALAHVVRAINRRTAREIHDEIRSVQASGMGSLPAGVRAGARSFLRVPGFLRRVVYRALFRSARFAKRNTGTMLVSAVGMFSGGASWGFSAPGIHNLSVVLGGIARRSSSTESEPERREVLCLTVSANHELVDGAPLARFARDLSARVEAAEGLAEAAAQTRGVPAGPS